MTHEALDENGSNAYYEDWMWGCKAENQSGIASNGERVTTALALRIAADVLRGMDPDTSELIIWTPNDMKLARAAISGIRAQAGMFTPDAEPLGKGDVGLMLTEVCDIAIYG